ncbi:hypothetical protein ACQU0X_25870 [Pseudovibrio ascidiaceicola]|uniref:hypothetical protein n=1 Tax=Pseudovibrio ascidiaceicola TaxID=285279 RepID=UPI003D359F80
MIDFEKDILPGTVGLRLCKIANDGKPNEELKLSESIKFSNGRPSVITTLQRAQLAGHVGGSIDKTTVYWADQLDHNGDHIGEIRLDKDSWGRLKNKWMKCKMLPSE